MPDALVPESAAPETPSAPVETSSSEAIYDSAFTEAFGDAGNSDVSPAPEPVVETPPAQTSQQAQFSLSHTKALERMGVDPQLLAGWPQEQVDAFVGRIAQMRAEQDQMGAELGRLRQPSQTPPQPTPQPQQPVFKDRLKGVFDKLVEDGYDEEIRPLGDLISQMHDSFDSRFGEMSGLAPMVNDIGSFLTDIALDQTLNGLTKTYPSMDTPDGRAKVTERFWKEWNTGEYSKPGASLRQQIREAAENAAKVTFNNITEASAATSLVNNNKARVAAQPKVGSSQNRPAPRSKDDIYDQAYQETMTG